MNTMNTMNREAVNLALEHAIRFGTAPTLKEFTKLVGQAKKEVGVGFLSSADYLGVRLSSADDADEWPAKSMKDRELDKGILGLARDGIDFVIRQLPRGMLPITDGQMCTEVARQLQIGPSDERYSDLLEGVKRVLVESHGWTRSGLGGCLPPPNWNAVSQKGMSEDDRRELVNKELSRISRTPAYKEEGAGLSIDNMTAAVRHHAQHSAVVAALTPARYKHVAPSPPKRFQHGNKTK